jgi:putative heme transporter
MEKESRRHSPLEAVSPGLLVAGIRSWLYLGIAACVIVTLLVLSAIAGLVVPLVIATVIAMLFYPVVDWLEQRRVPRVAGALGVMLTLLLVLVGALWLTIYGIIDQSDQIVRLLESGLNALEEWESVLSLPIGLFDWMLDSALNTLPQVFAGLGAFFSSSFSGAVALFVGLFLSAFLLYYLLTDWHGIVGWLARNIGLAPALGEKVITNTTQAVRRYFYALTLSSVVVSVSIGSTMALLGLPLAFTIGLVTMVTSYVPYLGAIVSGVFACLVALGSGGVGTAAMVLVIVLLMQNIIQTIIQNRLASNQLHLHPLVTFIATILGGTLVGVIGAMLATPATAAVIRAREEIARLRGGQAADEPAQPPIEDAVVAGGLGGGG